MRGLPLAGAALVASLLVGPLARADRLSSTETSALSRGATVTRGQTLERGGRRYVGGVAYAVVEAGADEIGALIDDIPSWQRFLPATRDVRRVGNVAGDALVEVTHGNSFIHVTYTLRVHREGDTMRFWMDPSRPHDIDDAWGYLRTGVLAGGRTLVTYGILIDVGGGLLRDLFEDQARRLALTVPERVRGIFVSPSRPRREPPLVAGAATPF
jgi:hypothetical protein